MPWKIIVRVIHHTHVHLQKKEQCKVIALVNKDGSYINVITYKYNTCAWNKVSYNFVKRLVRYTYIIFE